MLENMSISSKSPSDNKQIFTEAISLGGLVFT